MTDVATTTQSATLTSDWLNCNTSNYVYVPGTYTPTVTWYTSPSRIRLTMTEVERLRARAKKDKQLREILEKFTDHIDVVIDFGEG